MIDLEIVIFSCGLYLYSEVLASEKPICALGTHLKLLYHQKSGWQWGEVEVGKFNSFSILLKVSPLFPTSFLNKFSGIEMEDLYIENDFSILISFQVYLFYSKYRYMFSIN